MGEFDHGLGYSTVRHTQLYDINTASWSLGQLAPVAVSHHNTVVVDGVIWSVGGQFRGNFVADSVVSYDVANDVWRTHTSIPQPRKIGALVFQDDEDRFVYVAGDSRDDGFMSDLLVGTFATGS